MSARQRACVVVLALAAVCASPASARATVVLGKADADPGAVETDPTSRQCGYTGVIYAPGWHDPDPAPPPGSPPPGAPDSTVPPGGGVLTSWTISGQQAGTQVRLAVIRFVTDYELEIIERGPVETVPRTIDPITFPVHLAVSGGEQIALDVTNLMLPAQDCVFPTGEGSLSFTYVAGDQPADGHVSRFVQGDGYPETHVNLTATLEQPGSTPPPPPRTGLHWPRLTGIRWRAPRHGGHKRGTARNDRLLGGPGSDRLDGRRGDDVLVGDRFSKRQPARQRDRLVGGRGDDILYTGPGRNVVVAGRGRDLVVAERGHGRIRCGGGRDVVRLRRRHRYHLSGCERVVVRR